MQNNLINLLSGDVLSYSWEKNGQYIDSKINLEDFLENIKENYFAVRYRIFILFDDETINYEIPNEDILLTGSYNENYQNGQRRTLSFSLYNNIKEEFSSVAFSISQIPFSL